MTLTNQAGCKISSINSTTIVCQFTQPSNQTGPLEAQVLSNSTWQIKISQQVQIATILPSPTVTFSVAYLAINAQFLTIEGAGFDNISTPTTSSAQLSISGSSTSTSCQIYSVTSTQIVCANLSFSIIGNLEALVYSFGGSSGTPVQVAQIVNPPVIIVFIGVVVVVVIVIIVFI